MAKLYFRYGAMNSGKTTAIIQVAHNYEERWMKVLLIKPIIDTKWLNTISSRLGIARRVDIQLHRGENINILLDLYKKKNGNIDCILVDEVQFLDVAQIDDLFWITVNANIPVICYGLRSDFLLQSFPASERLFTLAHTIEELKTVCRCGKKAICNMRLQNETPIFTGDQIAIDWLEVSYESVCWGCYAKYKQASIKEGNKLPIITVKPKSKKTKSSKRVKKSTKKKTG